MLEKQFHDVYNALYELEKGICEETDNNCNKCPCYNHTLSYGCAIIRVKYEISKVEDRIKLRERNKSNNNK